MTTIDRIMNKLRNFYVPADEKYIREIIEEELTAVNGVDELIEFWNNYLPNEKYSNEFIGITCRSNLDRQLKSLKQTPIAEEYPCTECGGNAYEGYIVEEGNCKIAKGERLCKKCMEKRNPDFIEQDERLKDSQTKEVEKVKKCLQCGTHYNGGTIKFCSSDCCLKWNGMK